MPDGIRDVRPTNSGKAMKALPLSKQKVQLYTETVGHLICLSVCLFTLSISVDIIQDSTWPFVITAQPFLKWPRPLFHQPTEAGPCQSPRQLRLCHCGLRQTTKLLPMSQMMKRSDGCRTWQLLLTRVVFAGGTGGYVLVTEFRGMTLNGIFCADVLWPCDLVPLTDFSVYLQIPPCC